MKRNALVVIAALIGLWSAMHLILRRPPPSIAIVAHRGAAGQAPENTIMAVRAGIGAWAEYIEIDVQRSADGVLLLHHDPKIDGRAIAELPYDDIRAAGVDGEPIPTLDEALALFAERGHDHQMLIIEGKRPDLYPNIAAEIVAAVEAHNLRDRVVYMSFDQDWLREVNALVPDAPLGSIHVYPFNVPSIDGTSPSEAGMQHIGVYWASVLIDPTLIPRLHQRGLDVNVWTLDAPFMVRLMRWLGADAVTTNEPETMVFRLDP